MSLVGKKHSPREKKLAVVVGNAHPIRRDFFGSTIGKIQSKFAPIFKQNPIGF
jgi:hypothetical protein